jgi:hypothetical protein
MNVAMKIRPFGVITVFHAVTLCGVAAQPAPPDPQDGGKCREGSARFAVGEAYSAALAERARQTAGARIARKIEPDGAYTMDLRADRLNLEVDRADVVRRAWCG